METHAVTATRTAIGLSNLSELLAELVESNWNVVSIALLRRRVVATGLAELWGTDMFQTLGKRERLEESMSPKEGYREVCVQHRLRGMKTDRDGKVHLLNGCGHISRGGQQCLGGSSVFWVMVHEQCPGIMLRPATRFGPLTGQKKKSKAKEYILREILTAMAYVTVSVTKVSWDKRPEPSLRRPYAKTIHHSIIGAHMEGSYVLPLRSAKTIRLRKG